MEHRPRQAAQKSHCQVILQAFPMPMPNCILVPAFCQEEAISFQEGPYPSPKGLVPASCCSSLPSSPQVPFMRKAQDNDFTTRMSSRALQSHPLSMPPEHGSGERAGGALRCCSSCCCSVSACLFRAAPLPLLEYCSTVLHHCTTVQSHCLFHLQLCTPPPVPLQHSLCLSHPYSIAPLCPSH